MKTLYGNTELTRNELIERFELLVREYKDFCCKGPALLEKLNSIFPVEPDSERYEGCKSRLERINFDGFNPMIRDLQEKASRLKRPVMGRIHFFFEGPFIEAVLGVHDPITAYNANLARDAANFVNSYKTYPPLPLFNDGEDAI